VTRLTRRRTLRATGLGIGLLCAGCLRGSGNDGDGNGGPNAVTVSGTDALQLGPRKSAPDWASGDAAGTAQLFGGPEGARDALSFDAYDKPSEKIQSHIDGTEHPAAQLLYVESVGPNTCYTEVVPSKFAVTDGRLGGTLTAARPEDTPSDGACGEALTYPGALVQVLYSGHPPKDGSVTVVSGSGSETTVDVSVGDGK